MVMVLMMVMMVVDRLDSCPVTVIVASCWPEGPEVN